MLGLSSAGRYSTMPHSESLVRKQFAANPQDNPYPSGSREQDIWAMGSKSQLAAGGGTRRTAADPHPFFKLQRTPSGNHEYFNISDDHETLPPGTPVCALWGDHRRPRKKWKAYEAIVERRNDARTYQVRWKAGGSSSAVLITDMRLVLGVDGVADAAIYNESMSRSSALPWKQLREATSCRERLSSKGPLLDRKACGHDCSPSIITTCCSCSDKRPQLRGNTYPEYRDGVGWTDTAPRNAGYCPICKRS